MDSWTNIKHLEFLERSAPFIAFDPFRRVGIMATDTSENQMTMWAGGIYATGSTFWNGSTGTNPAGSSTVYSTTGNDNRFGTTLGNGLSGAFRASHLLWYDEPTQGRYLLHAGGGYNYSQIGGSGTTGTDAQTFEARSIPEFYVGDQAGFGTVASGTPNVIDSGRFLAKHYQLVHAELAGNYGSAHFQAEVMGDFVAQMNSTSSVNYTGAYFQCGYFLTGEACGYNKLMGAMDYNVKPYSQFLGMGRNAGFCGFGAWEAAFRWSYLNLSSDKIVAANQLSGAGTPGSGATLGVNPGILNEYTAALNWWWNEYTRVQFNLIRSDVQSNRTGFNALSIAAVRFQVEF
jgi:phosphate-selective porin OprO/OprP